MPQHPKHLLTLLEFSNKELQALFSLGTKVKSSPARWQKALAGKSPRIPLAAILRKFGVK